MNEYLIQINRKIVDGAGHRLGTLIREEVLVSVLKGFKVTSSVYFPSHSASRIKAGSTMLFVIYTCLCKL